MNGVPVLARDSMGLELGVQTTRPGVKDRSWKTVSCRLCKVHARCGTDGMFPVRNSLDHVC